MKSIAILTPSYRPDLGRFRRLHESVLRFTADDVIHHAIVPARDVNIFGRLESERLRVWPESAFMPRGFLATDRLAALSSRVPVLPATFRCSAINLRRPWPPIRGWVLQQLLKLSSCTSLDVDAVVIIDSDVVLVRPMASDRYFRDGVVRLYERPGGITASMERHMTWTRTAHRLLGLPDPGVGPHPDYVGGIVSWDPLVVQACLDRVEEVTGRDWATAIGGELHFSEFVLYGTYLRHFGTSHQRSHAEPRTLCHSHWDYEALGADTAAAFLEAFGAQDVAVHIQSNSGTSTETIDLVVDTLTAEVQRDRP